MTAKKNTKKTAKKSAGKTTVTMTVQQPMKPKFIVWYIDDEIIICKPSDEKKMMQDYGFNTLGGRNVDEYDRREIYDTVLVVSNRLMVC